MASTSDFKNGLVLNLEGQLWTITEFQHVKPGRAQPSCGRTELAVTDQRVIYKTGLLARHTLEMNRARVESVTVDQTVLGRVFGYGTVTVRGVGSALEPIREINDPLTFRSHLTHRVSGQAFRRGPACPSVRTAAAIPRSRTSRGRCRSRRRIRP